MDFGGRLGKSGPLHNLSLGKIYLWPERVWSLQGFTSLSSDSGRPKKPFEPSRKACSWTQILCDRRLIFLSTSPNFSKRMEVNYEPNLDVDRKSMDHIFSIQGWDTWDLDCTVLESGDPISLQMTKLDEERRKGDSYPCAPCTSSVRPSCAKERPQNLHRWSLGIKFSVPEHPSFGFSQTVISQV